MYFEMLARCGGKRLHARMHPSTTLKKFQADLYNGREGKGREMAALVFQGLGFT
jgi:hypothetical protein